MRRRWDRPGRAPRQPRPTTLFHLAWSRNLDRFDVALAANRLVAHGARLWWLGAAGPRHEPGDYLCEATIEAGERLEHFGVVAPPWQGPVPESAIPLAHPRIALLAGRAAAYPSFAYYAMALARLGFDCALVDGAAIAAGALRHADLLVLPGGRALWGLDAADGVVGADLRVREFLAEGGAAIGSGAGAFYLSAGRPGWSGTAAVRPRFTHERRGTGTGIVGLRLGADSIGFGCPPTLEMAYGEGPIYDVLDRSASSAATFETLALPGSRLAPSPLDADSFARDMEGHTAILRAEGRRGRAILFSPHPEMGDLVRKYIAFDTYAAQSPPLDGEAAIEDMLRQYAILDAPAYRPIANAIHSLMLRREPPLGPPLPIAVVEREEPPRRLVAGLAAALAQFAVAEGELGTAVALMLRDGLRARLTRLGPRLEQAERTLLSLSGPSPAIRRLWIDCEEKAADALVAAPPPALGARLAEIETALSLGEAWCLLAEAEIHFAGL